MRRSLYRLCAFVGLVAVLAGTAVSCSTGGSTNSAGSSPGNGSTERGSAGFDGPAGYVGAIPALDAFVAVVSGAGGTVVYLCDQGTRSEWFRSDAPLGDTDTTDHLELANAADNHVTLARDGTQLAARVTLVDGADYEVRLDPVNGVPVMYRGMAASGDDTVLGGWILNGAEQRGAIVLNPGTKSPAVSSAPALNTGVTTRTSTTSTTTTTTISPVSVPPISRPGNPITVLLPTPIKIDLLAFPITPPALGTATRNTVTSNRFVLAALGDSYGSGEGNPVTFGNYKDDGVLPDKDPRPEVWTRDGLPAGIEQSGDLRCHRSDDSGSGFAARSLQGRYPGIDLRYRSFACSGAEVKHLIDTDYTGAEYSMKTDSPKVEPQLTQLADWVRDRQFDHVDAVEMSIGGNNGGFADVVAKCIDPTAGNCADSDVFATKVQPGVAGLNDTTGGAPAGGWYEALQSALVQKAPGARVYIQSYPDPISTDTAGQGVCHDGGGRMDGDITANLSEAEARFARDQVLTALNSGVSTGANRHGWVFLGAIHDRSVGRGICHLDSIVNTNNDGLHHQGREDDLGAPGLVNISWGIVHPNRDGFQLFGDVIADEIGHQIESRFTTVAPARVRETKATRNGDIEMTWDDQSINEQRFEITATPVGGGTPERFQVGADTVTFTHHLTRPSTYTYSVVACGFIGCSAPATGIGSNVPPSGSVLNPTVTSQVATSRDVLLNLTWVNNAENATYWVIEAKDASGNNVAAAARSDRSNGGSIRVPGNTDVTVQVRSCNVVDNGTCGPPSVVVPPLHTRPTIATTAAPTTTRLPPKLTTTTIDPNR